MKAEEMLSNVTGFGEWLKEEGIHDPIIEAMEKFATHQIMKDRQRIKEHAKILVETKQVKFHVESYYTKDEAEFIEVSHESIDVTPLILE